MVKTILFFLIIVATQNTFAKEVAITIDDAPRENENIFSGLERTKRLIDILKRRKIHTVFFCNSVRFDQANGKERIQMYSEAGFTIANHTHSHPSLSSTPIDAYIKDIDLADQALKPFPTFKKWFRYPYLDEGSTVEMRDQVRHHLRDLGYINGYVTVDTFDYLINDLMQRAVGEKRKVNRPKACEMLIDLALEGLEYQEKLAIQQLGKSVKQILLTHENDLEAICMDQMIDSLHAKGWKIIPPADAFDEPGLLPLKRQSMSELEHEFDRRGIVENSISSR